MLIVFLYIDYHSKVWGQYMYVFDQKYCKNSNSAKNYCNLKYLFSMLIYFKM